MTTQKQKLRLLLFGSIILIVAFLTLAYQNGSLFKSDLLGSDMLSNLNKTYFRYYSYDLAKYIGTTSPQPQPQSDGWFQVSNAPSGSTANLSVKTNSQGKALGLLNMKTSGIGSILAAMNWGATTTDKIEIETRVQVVGAAGCEIYTSSFLLFTNGSKTGYLTFCKDQIIVSSDTQKWQRNSQFAPGAKNTISNVDLATAPKDLKIIVDGTKISVYEVKTTDVLLGEFANAMYTGLPDYTGITNASKINESSLLFGSFASSVGSTNYGTETNWGYIRAKVIPTSQFSGSTKGTMSFNYDAASGKNPYYLGWIGGQNTNISQGNLQISYYDPYKTQFNLQEYDSFDIEAGIQAQANSGLTIAFGTDKAEGYVSFNNSSVSYSKNASYGTDSTIAIGTTLHNVKISVKGMQMIITDKDTGKSITVDSGMHALSTPAQYGYLSFKGTAANAAGLQNIKITAKPYTIDNTQDTSRKFTREYGYLANSLPNSQAWSTVKQGNNSSYSNTSTQVNGQSIQYMHMSTALTDNLDHSFKWNASKDDDISIEAKLRIPQTTCAFSASNYLMFSNGDKMGYITFCQNEIRVSGANLPFTKTLRYNQILSAIPQNQRNIYAFSANMASEFAVFKITLKDGKDIIITTPDNQTFTIANGLYFNANDTSQSPYPNAITFGSSSNETTTTPATLADWSYVNYKLTSRTQNGKNYTYAYDANLVTPPSAQGWVFNSPSSTEQAVTGQKTFINNLSAHYSTFWNADPKDTLVIDTSAKSNAGCSSLSDSNTFITFSNGVTKGSVAFCKTGAFISDPSSGNGYKYVRSYVGEPDNVTTIDNSTLKNFKIIVKNLNITVLDATTGKEVATVWGGFNNAMTSNDKNAVTFGGYNSEWKYFKATLSKETTSSLADNILRLHFSNVQWSIMDKTANTLKSTFTIAESVPTGTVIEMCTQNTLSTSAPICTKAVQTGNNTFAAYPSKNDVPLNNNLPVGGTPATLNYQWFVKVNGIPYGVEGPLNVYYSPEILMATTAPTDPKIKVIFDTIQDTTATLQVGVAPSQSQYTLEKVCILAQGQTGTGTCKNNTGTSRTMTNAPTINDQDYNWSMYYAGFTGLTPGVTYQVNVTVSRFSSTQPVISGGTFTTHKASASSITSSAVYGIPQDTVFITQASTVNNILWTYAGSPAKANIQFDMKDATTKTVEICYKLNGASTNTCNPVNTTTPGTTKTYAGIASGIDLTSVGTRTYLWNIQVDGKHFGVEGTLTVSPTNAIPGTPQIPGTTDPAFIQAIIAPITDTGVHINLTVNPSTGATNPTLNSICISDILGNAPLCETNPGYSSISNNSSGYTYVYDVDYADLTPGMTYKIQYKINTNSGVQTYNGRSFQTSKSAGITIIPGDVIISSTDNPVRNISWVTGEANQQFLKVSFDVLTLPTPSTPVSLCYKEENNAQATDTCKVATLVSGTLYSVLTDIPLNSTKTYSWYIKIGDEKSGTAGTGLAVTSTPEIPGSSEPAAGTPLAAEGIALSISNITDTSVTLSTIANVSNQVVTSICVARSQDSSNELCNDQATPSVQSGNVTSTTTFTGLLPGKEYTTRVLFTRGLTETDLFSRDGQKFTTATKASTGVGGNTVVTPPTDTQAPSIVITSPANNSVYSKVSDISFSGTATDLGVSTSGIDKVMIGIKSTGTDAKWLTIGTDATWGSSEVYYPATGTENWIFTAQDKSIPWENGKTYQVFTYGIDKAQNSGKASPVIATFTYSLPVDTTAPTATISLPGVAATTLSGTARDTGTPSSGLKNIKVSIKDDTANTYWNGSAFTATTETYLGASLGGVSGDDTVWSYPPTGAITFTDNKSYTVHAYAEDNSGNKNSTSPVSRTFIYDDGQAAAVDTQAPTVFIDAIAATATSITGSAVDTGTVTSGIKSISISIKDNAANKWFSTEGFTESAVKYLNAKIQLTGAASATWSFPEADTLPFQANKSYTISVYGIDIAGNSTEQQPVSKTFTYVPVESNNGNNNGNANNNTANSNVNAIGNSNNNSGNGNSNTALTNSNQNTIATGNGNENAISNMNNNALSNANNNSSNSNQNTIVNSNNNSGNGNGNALLNTNNNSSNSNQNTTPTGSGSTITSEIKIADILSTTPVWATDKTTSTATFLLSRDPGNTPVYFCINTTCVIAQRQSNGSYVASINNTLLPVDKDGTYLWSVKIGTETISSNGVVTVNPQLSAPLLNTGSNNTYTAYSGTPGGTTIINNYYPATGNTNINNAPSTNANTNDLKASPTYCPPSCPEFTLPRDIADSYFAAESISFLGARNIIAGYTDGTFKPDNAINRAEFSKVVKNAFLLSSTMKAAAMPFKDVSVLNWFYTPIRALYNANLVQGYPSGDFFPGRYIQRDEAAKILAVEHANLASAKALPANASIDRDTLGEAAITAQWNQWKNENPRYTYVIFPDISVNDWAAKYILYAYNLNLITGRTTAEGLRFEPNEYITRAEAATLLAKIVQSLNIKYPSTGDTSENIQIVFPE